MKRVHEMTGPAATRAIAILKNGAYVGKIIANYSNLGACTVGVWDWTQAGPTVYSESRACGYGYDKFSAALSGCKFAGVTFPEGGSWEHALREAGYETITLL